MTISQGESPRGTCPGDLSSVNRPKPVIPQWFPPKLVDQSRPRVRCSTSGRPTHSLCSNVRARVLWWHTMIGDLKAEYHSVNDSTADRPWLRLSRLRDNETNTHRDSGVPSCDDLLRCSSRTVGRTGSFMGQSECGCGIIGGN